MWSGQRDRKLPEIYCGLLLAQRRRLLEVKSRERGGAMVELALVLPILLIMVTGIYSVGLLLRQDMQLTDSVNVGAMLLAVNRGNTLDPCSLASTAIVNSSPFLDTTKMSFSYVLNGTSYSGTTCSSSTTTTGAAGNLVQGTAAQVTVTYPCSISIYLAPVVPGCTISASLSEIVQ